MIDLEQRLRRTFSALAGNEALSGALDENAAAELLKWGEALAESFVRKTGEMEDDAAEEFLSPYLRALRTSMRALGGWLEERDPVIRQQWWARMEHAGRTLFGGEFTLPPMEAALSHLPADASGQQVVAFIKNLMETQRSGG